MKPMTTESKADLSTINVQADMDPKHDLNFMQRPEEFKEKRKRLRIIAISVVVLVVIVIAAIIAAVCLVGKQAEANIKTAWLPYKDESGKSSTQKVTVTSREEKFEIAGTGTAVFDFDKSLFVYKPEQVSKPSCFLTAVNTSYLLSPDKMKDLNENKMSNDVSSKPSENDYFMSSNVVVPNKDFLSPLSKELCKDTEVIWMVPKPDCVDDKSLTRRKRGCYYKYYCYYYVYKGYLYYKCYRLLYC
ncbi:hypothetical protein CHS0354_035597 [Potamilus streckersoni]|uniref:BRICHOS domain-containing protein n=1 Tax=Potamilus streckersoni TaxID=2493646 RepID=A0AAE0RRL5_9BIVA|nr:hypothetical protein CHS0354_035597 [Potamilus streckersoni]